MLTCRWAQGATLYAAAIESDTVRQGYSSEEERLQRQRQDTPHHSRSPHTVDVSEWNRLMSAPLVAAAGDGGGSAMPGSCEATAVDGSARPESTSKRKQDNNNQQEQEREQQQKEGNKEAEQHRTVRRLTHQPFDALSASPRPTFLTEKTTVGTVDLTRCVYAEEVVRCKCKCKTTPVSLIHAAPWHFDKKSTNDA
eukprot:COSAG06_NODE_576_length_14051_cov_5.354644_12_plen_196_part_00